MTSQNLHTHHSTTLSALTLGALGVVYGDIGTSPLYAMRECLETEKHVAPGEASVLGVLSLMFWALVLLVSFKYIVLTLRANQRGEGGILTLLSIALNGKTNGAGNGLPRAATVMFGLLGAALLYGDASITPAISVLSAIEGLEVIEPSLHRWIIPCTLGILFGLFMVQQFGTARIGRTFGPIILVWFFTLGSLGLVSIAQTPQVLEAINPMYAVAFVRQEGWSVFLVLSGVVLVVTGAEAIYADMGHFGAQPIRIGWFCCALPGLLLNYFGQGAALLRDPSAAANPFYAVVPQALTIPMVVLATAATIIASQAVITGLYSLSHQASLLEYLPRLRVIHTSAAKRGQIYLPMVNWCLMLATMGLVVGFKSSDNLASAYGIAVMTTMIFTSMLLLDVARRTWKWTLLYTVPVFGVILFADTSLFFASLIKFADGGWFPVVLAIALYLTFTTWRRGRELTRQTSIGDMPVEAFVENVTRGEHAVKRVPGTAVFLNRNATGTPRTLGHNVKCNKVLHETIIILSIVIEDLPHVFEEHRIELKALGNGLYRVIARYGFMERPDVLDALRKCEVHGLAVDVVGATFFVGREVIVSTAKPGMARWRKQYHAFLARNAAAPTSFFNMPANQTVEFGLQVEI